MNQGEALFKIAILLAAILFGIFLLYAEKIRARTTKKEEPADAPAAPPANAYAASPATDQTFCGTLRLKGVNEQTAAIIMAVVSDESGIPLDQLQFRSISLLPQGEDA